MLGPVVAQTSAQYQRGEKLFNANCLKCHAAVEPDSVYRQIPIDRDDPKRRIKAVMVPVSELGTDPATSDNFLYNYAETGILEGKKKKIFAGEKFGETAMAVELLINSVIGVMGGHPIKAYKGAKRAQWMNVPAACVFDPNSYKGRPLNGIWATAPFLHNGSVPNLRELLKPEDQRVDTFYVGSWEYDPQNVGYVSTKPTDDNIKTFKYDTSLRGNSNMGHSGPGYGTDLNAADKEALIEYMKTL